MAAEAIGAIRTAVTVDAPDAMPLRVFNMLKSPSTYEWTPGVTPFSHFSWCVAAVAAYLITIFSLQAWMKTQKERYELKTVVKYHNLLLCIWSAAMCAGTVLMAALKLSSGGTFFDLMCDGDHDYMKGYMGFIAWSYYFSKYYELLDTVIMVLRKRPLTVLHVYHHCIILVVTWTWNNDKWGLHWYGIFVNTLVHTFMYYYYWYSAATGKRLWWRKWMTTGQLTQFLSVFFLIFVWFHVALENKTYSTTFPFVHATANNCSGSVPVVVISQSMNISFLFLFGNFFLQQYIFKKPRVDADGRPANGNKKGGNKKGGNTRDKKTK